MDVVIIIASGAIVSALRAMLARLLLLRSVLRRLFVEKLDAACNNLCDLVCHSILFVCACFQAPNNRGEAASVGILRKEVCCFVPRNDLMPFGALIVTVALGCCKREGANAFAALGGSLFWSLAQAPNKGNLIHFSLCLSFFFWKPVESHRAQSCQRSSCAGYLILCLF